MTRDSRADLPALSPLAPSAPDPDAGALTDAEVAAWLRLAATPGLGPVGARRLLAAFGLPERVLAQDAARLGAHVPADVVRALLAPPDDAMAALIDRTLAWRDAPHHHLLTLADAAYPARLFDLHDPPPLLYVNGHLDTLARPALAIVGARKATDQGRQDAESFAAAFSRVGLAVISGLALGVDAAAHAGGLSGPGGTVAVIGTGADIVYPARHRDLAHAVAAHGAIVSEFPLGTRAVGHHFPRRNRIIAALSRGVLVIEAAERSGSLITARFAAELGREVLAVPGSIHSALSRGGHRLIRDGARLVEAPADVFEEFTDLNLPPAGTTLVAAGDTAGRTQCSDTLGAALAYDPVTLDDICARSGMRPDTVATALLELELAGAVERLPGNRYRRCSRIGR
ncbi:DNA-processing protein DprA [Cupriavidus plantarum]|uniref:DNA-processing protein DprA n=1 Tax=Cupriavidus plantarum TaxID=942865 RepID=UPI000E361F8B|nr:DNA processing protein [Cupriavidus plantarum]REE92601.1 DNA protecting protein DprA [Cupriavidus plantarum]